jgi:anaerobic selenocysteine-containing dehydrogenase
MPQVIRTYCQRMCSGTCGIQVHLSGGRVTRVEGDPASPFNRGHICPKARALPELLYHPDRLTRPLVRTGARGEGHWRPASTDEALEIIARRLEEISRDFGPESILLYEGAYRGLERTAIQRLASVLGTPNTVSVDNVCHAPRKMASRYTYGGWAVPDYDHPPRCLLVWGRNSLQTGGDAPPARFRRAFDGGTRFIVVDPRKISLASRADVWLTPRPGSDGLLALGLLHVIVHEELYDQAFVSRWTVGFERLRAWLNAYPLDEVGRRTWVPASEIRAAARLYATSGPAAIQWGNALDQTGNAFQTARALAILRAITGNLDVPGGDIFRGALPLRGGDDFAPAREPVKARPAQVGSQYPLAAEARIVPSQEASRAILSGRPFPLKAGLILGSNPLLTYPNAQETYRALEKLDFLVVAELFMTPTAALADIVLPVAASLEYDDLVDHAGCLAARPKILDPPGECLSDLQWVNRIASRLGLGKYFWEDEVGAMDAMLAPAGLTWEQLVGLGLQRAEVHYRKHLNGGFPTPSGKVELFSERLQVLGIDPLPGYREPPQTPFGSPELTGDYPLVLTNCKNPVYYHASHRQLPSLRRRSPEPVAELHPETGAKLGLRPGDVAYIETPRGRIRQKVRLNADLDPRVVVAAFGWWFPEQGPAGLYGWREANLNLLTDSAPPHDPAMGSANLRGLVCRVYRAEEDHDS